MKISQEELERRLGSSKNLVNRFSFSEKNKENKENKENKRGNDSDNRNNAGRLPEAPNAPKSLRVVAGVLAKAEGNATVVARNLDLTSGQVLYAEKSEKVIPTEKKVQEIALTRLMDSLNLLTLPSLIGEKPKDLASIAANLSRVHSNLRPKEDREGNQVNVTIYSPKQREISEYDVIEVKTGT
jgi:hypothetical protein